MRLPGSDAHLTTKYVQAGGGARSGARGGARDDAEGGRDQIGECVLIIQNEFTLQIR